MAKDASELTEKQKRFAEEYLIDLNATAAYKRAGYKATGHGAETNASKLLSNTEIQKYIALKQTKLQEKVEITQERVLAEYAKLAFHDPRKFFDENGNLIPIHKLDDATSAAVAGMDIHELNGEAGSVIGFAKKIKISDKRAALDSIARTLGMFKDNLKIEEKNAINIEDVDQRIAELLAKQNKKK